MIQSNRINYRIIPLFRTRKIPVLNSQGNTTSEEYLVFSPLYITYIFVNRFTYIL